MEAVPVVLAFLMKFNSIITNVDIHNIRPFSQQTLLHVAAGKGQV